jgi:Protein of unknown function (DUF3106).
MFRLPKRRLTPAGFVALRLVAVQRFVLGLTLLCAGGFWLAAQAADVPHAQLAWTQLTPMQKAALAPLEAEWPHFGADRKRKWLNIASRYSAMSPEQRITLHHRMVEWVHMSPQQRRQARENFLATSKAPLDSRKQAWERYQKLPEAEKRELAREAKRPPHAPGHVGRYEAEQRLKRQNSPLQPTTTRPQGATAPAITAPAATTPANLAPATKPASAAAGLATSNLTPEPPHPKP